MSRFLRREIMADTTSQQITDAIVDFIAKTNPLHGYHMLIVEMSSLTYTYLASVDPSPILDPSRIAHTFRGFKSFRTKLGFPFPKPDGLMKVHCNGEDWVVFVYLENKMKLLKVRMSMVQVIHQTTVNP
jgi:hypothetical protein